MTTENGKCWALTLGYAKTVRFGPVFYADWWRGLRGVELVISDAGLKQAIEQVLTGATWQRCCVHVMRNILSQVPKSSQGMVSAIIRIIFAQPSYEAAKSQLQRVVDELSRRFKNTI